jgi:hypothetical protein
MNCVQTLKADSFHLDLSSDLLDIYATPIALATHIDSMLEQENESDPAKYSQFGFKCEYQEGWVDGAGKEGEHGAGAGAGGSLVQSSFSFQVDVCTQGGILGFTMLLAMRPSIHV